MIKKFVVSVFCMLVIISGFSFGVLAEQNKKIIISENIIVDVNPIEKNDYSLNTNSNPVVNITSPENGTYLPTPILEILGYAYSPDGLNFIEIFYYWNNYLSDYENGTFNASNYVNFRIQITILQPGTHKIVVRFSDIYNHSGSDSVTVYYTGNQPPEKPDKPSGPNTGSIDVSYSYSTASTDPENNQIYYFFNWGDGSDSGWLGPYTSGFTISATHKWTIENSYSIKVKAKDTLSAESSWSESLTVTISREENNPPNKPATPNGEASGKIGVSYIYESSTTDSDGNQIYYLFDWGDGTDSEWVGPYDSGDICQESHIWNTKGSYSIKVKAKDTLGAESSWSDPLPISMPYSYNPILQFLDLFFQRFSNTFPVIRQLMGY